MSSSANSIEPSTFINREMSWLEFNQRVLDQALDPNVLALERAKFLAITCGNLDEFFMVRVGGLQLQQAVDVRSTDPAGMSVQQQLTAIYARGQEMVTQQYEVFLKQLEPLLAEHGIKRVLASDCSVKQRKVLKHFFREQIQAVLSPMGISPDAKFPLLANRSLYVGVQLEAKKEASKKSAKKQPKESSAKSEENGSSCPPEEAPYRFVLIPLGSNLPRVITLPTDEGFSYALLEDVVRHFAREFFPNEKVVSTTTFRITRNADVDLQEDAAADLLHGMKEVLELRKTAECVRLEIDDQASDEMRTCLAERLKLSDEEIAHTPNPIDLSYLMRLAGLEGYDHLRNEPWPPQRSPELDPSQTMFDSIAEQDILLCHPYESYQPVVRFIEEAASDPDVLAIKQTLYRTSKDSPIVAALRQAAERGKYVTAIVELKARFDEARNIEWAEELEQAGVQIIYGVKYLKTHAKVCIIVRREHRGITRYMHFGTGNYNEATASLYSDISYFTSRPELGTDAGSFFNAITGLSQPQQYKLLEAAPIGMRKKVLTLIDGEIERRKQGQRASIVAKLNSLVDPEMIQALYRASQAGVTVKLNIRGICCLRPGVRGLSENITVVSIVDRLLEHARIMSFHHGGDELTFISSADWMPRNLDKRIELLVPVLDPTCRTKLLKILDTYFKDTTNSWQLESDGEFQRRSVSKDKRFRAQEHLYRSAVEALKLADQQRATVFEPHHPAKNR